MLLLTIPFICPFFFLSSKTFRHRILSSCYSQSLQICVCVCVNFFFRQELLKFGTNVGYNLLYCVKENQPSPAYHLDLFPLIIHFSFSPIKISVTDF